MNWNPASHRRYGLAVIALIGMVATTLPVPASHPTSKPSSKAKLLAEGKALFGKNCVVCHGANGIGDEGPRLRNLSLSDAAISWKIKNGKKDDMPAFWRKLKDAQIKSITAYLRTLR